MTDVRPEAVAPRPEPQRSPRRLMGRIVAYLISAKTPILLLIIFALVLSNVALWIQCGRNPADQSVTVVAVRQMTNDYMRQIGMDTLTPQESAARVSAFVVAAQTELATMVPSDRLVLARECVLSGKFNDLTDDLNRRVLTKMAALTGGLSNAYGSVSPAAPPATGPMFAPAQPRDARDATPVPSLPGGLGR